MLPAQNDTSAVADGQIAPSPQATKRAASRESAPDPRPRLVECPDCGRLIPFEVVGSHCKTAHPAKSLRGTHNQRLVSSPPARKHELRRNAAKTKKKTHIYKHLPVYWDTLKPNYVATCKFCGAGIDQALLPGHVRDAHRISDPFEMVPISRRPPDRVEPPRDLDRPRDDKTTGSRGFNNLGQYFGDVRNSRDRLDGSKGKHVVREHGRYGSHPVHDRFDDDSNA